MSVYGVKIVKILIYGAFLYIRFSFYKCFIEGMFGCYVFLLYLHRLVYDSAHTAGLSLTRKRCPLEKRQETCLECGGWCTKADVRKVEDKAPSGNLGLNLIIYRRPVMLVTG